MGSFATIGDYYKFKGEEEPEHIEPDVALKMNAGLERATDAVREMLRLTKAYPRRPDGLPRAASMREAIVRATAAQYDWIRERGEDFTGAGNEWDSVAFMEVSFSKRAGSAASTMSPAESLYAPEASRILVNAGFYTNRVRHAGRR